MRFNFPIFILFSFILCSLHCSSGEAPNDISEANFSNNSSSAPPIAVKTKKATRTTFALQTITTGKL